ncbi:MAG: aspartate 1-decarboxylase [Alphaproteobacteria bacterium]
MRRTLLKSKIHRATVTEADLMYEGSISIDPAFCALVDLVEHEQVDVYNCTNGERFTTYVILGKAGQICINGAAARLVAVGDQIIIAAYAQFEEDERTTHHPKILVLDAGNAMRKL